MKKIIAVILVGLLLLFSLGFWQLYFSNRPPLTINPLVLSGDGSQIDYCELPILDGRSKLAADRTHGCAVRAETEHICNVPRSAYVVQLGICLCIM